MPKLKKSAPSKAKVTRKIADSFSRAITPYRLSKKGKLKMKGRK